VSADSRWLAYVSNESDRNEVYIQSFPSGTQKWQVSSDGGDQPIWRAHKNTLVYLDASGMLTEVTITAAGPKAGTRNACSS
jgi:Tol biopolymer transport system component